MGVGRAPWWKKECEQRPWRRSELDAFEEPKVTTVAEAALSQGRGKQVGGTLV